MYGANDDATVVVISTDDGTAFAAGPFRVFAGAREWDARNGATMQPQTLERRVERLEARVTKLEELPARMDALSTQITQLREETHSGFSNLRDELRAEIRGVDARVAGLDAHVNSLDAHVTSLDAHVTSLDARVTSLDERLSSETRAAVDYVMSEFRLLYLDLKAEIRAGDERVLSQVGIWLADLKASSARIEEALSTRRPPRSRPRRK